MRKTKSPILAAVHDTAKGLHKAGVMDQVTLREVHAPSGPEMDAKLGDTVAHRLYVAEKTSFKPLGQNELAET